MDARTKRARDYLKSLITEDALRHLLEKLLLTKFERSLLYGVYRDGKTLSNIADDAGYSLGAVKRIHRGALIKVATYMDSATE